MLAPGLRLLKSLLARLPAFNAGTCLAFPSVFILRSTGTTRGDTPSLRGRELSQAWSASSAGIRASPRRSRPAVAMRKTSLVTAPRKDFCADTPQPGGHERALNAATLFPIPPSLSSLQASGDRDPPLVPFRAV